MTTRTRTGKLAALLACSICLGVTAALLGIGFTPQAQATSSGMASDPRIGDYSAAQLELEQHLEQRLKLHLARAAKLASR